MPSQRVIVGIGLAVLLMISAASIGLDVEARSDAAWVNHTLRVLMKLSDLRLLVRRAESSARGFGLTKDTNLLKDFQDASDQVAPAFAELAGATRDNPAMTRLLRDTEKLVAGRFAVSRDAIRLHQTNDSAGLEALRARGEGRAIMDMINANFDRLTSEEQGLLAIRTADSRRTGAILLAIDLLGAALVLVLVALLMRESRRANRKLESSLSASKATNVSLEAAVLERTEHLQSAHEQLRATASVLQSTFNSIAEAVLVIDPEGQVVLWNPAAEQTLRYRAGMSIEQMRSLGTAYAADGMTALAPHDMPIAQVLRGEQYDDKEIVIRQTGDSGPPQHLVVSGRPLRDPSGAIAGAALVYHDITAARETERQLQQSQKLEAIGKLTGGIAHDFNNMLTVIAGTTETLVEALRDRPDIQGVARLIDDATQRCAELVKHLLAFARKQPLQPRDVDVNGTILDVAKLLRPTLGEQIEIETVLCPDANAAHIDPSQLANSVINMAINARDAMPNGGKLVLETSNVVLDETYAHANPDVPPGPYVLVAVSDSGTGMPQSVQDKAFDPFFTTKEVGKGTGLGLSMVYGFVKQSGGHIKIYSEEGHGTTIKLYLPPPLGQFEAVAATSASIPVGSETIMVVEDDEMVRNFVVVQLESLGYTTIAAADSRAALAHIDNGEPFDLLFTDVVMPGGMSGRDLACAVVKRRPGLKVLYTSGYTDNAIVHHGRLDPGVLLLTKPYRKPQLAQMVRLALGGDAVSTITASRARPRRA
jgi:PAS domain S-box-containing protein